MKKFMFMCLSVIYLSCDNSNGSNAIPTNQSDTSIDKKTISPTPGLGSDPTRIDATKENPIGGQGDSGAQKNDARPTPGLGSDPTRNQPDPAPAQPVKE